MRRAGHGDIATTMGYVREAENLMHPVGEPFPPLPAALMVRPRDRPPGAYCAEMLTESGASPAGFEPWKRVEIRRNHVGVRMLAAR